MAWFWKIIRVFLVLGIAFGSIISLVAISVGWWGSSRLVEVGRADLEEAHREVYAQPEQFGFQLERFDVSSADGLTLKACVLTPDPAAELSAPGRRVRKEISLRNRVDLPLRNEIRGTIVMGHGREGRMEHNFAIAKRFTAVGFRCVLFDARAHGKSGGEICTYGFFEREDLRRVIAGAEEKVGDLGPVGLFGVSLGGAVGLQAMDGSDDYRCGVFVSPFAALNESAWRVAEEKLGAWRFAVVPPTDVVLGWRHGFRMIEAAPVASASRIDEPVMLVHGEEDEMVPITDSETILKALESEAKTLRRVEGGDHHAVLMQGGDELYAEMCEFFLQHMWG